ncbi:hypothetical protein HID58_075247, partial [Brassica napus]
IEYIRSDRSFENLPHDEQKLWHSHAYEAYPRLPQVEAAPELKNIAKAYGKFWCTWQIHRATIMQRRLPVKQTNFNICDLPWRHVMAHRDHLPLRPPPSSQQVPPVRSDKLPKGAPELMMTPQGVLRPELVKFRDDKCFALDIMTVEMNRNEQFP